MIGEPLSIGSMLATIRETDVALASVLVEKGGRGSASSGPQSGQQCSATAPPYSFNFEELPSLPEELPSLPEELQELPEELPGRFLEPALTESATVAPEAPITGHA
jgi:hypothetical protein